jgi:putative glutamine amidotransferase
MRIGVTMRVDQTKEYYEPRDAVSHDWIRLLQAWDYTPQLIPNLTSNVHTVMEKLDGIILTGGNNLCPDLSCIPADIVGDTASDRDDLEKRLLNVAMDLRVPVLGICRGLQLINCHLGGCLIRADKKLHVNSNHQVEISGGNWKSLLGKNINVNSFHEYGISEDSVGKDIIPFANSQDGLVEGFVHNTFPFLGIMWHPERPCPCEDTNKILFTRLFTEGSFWSKE